jgi:hypothetical protein
MTQSALRFFKVVLPAAFALAMCLAFLQIGCDQPPPPTSPPALRTYAERPMPRFRDQIELRVLDATGRNLEGAKVWLAVHTLPDQPISQERVTDELGRAAIAISKEAQEELIYGTPATMWIVDSQGLVSAADVPPDWLASEGKLIELRLATVIEPTAVRVLSPSGEGVPYARLAPRGVALAPDNIGRILPAEVWQAASSLVDENGYGRAQVPAGQLNGRMRIQSERFGVQELETLNFVAGQPAEFLLAPCGLLACKIVAPDGAPVRLRVSSFLPSGQIGRATRSAKSGDWFELLIAASAKVRIEASVLDRADLIAYPNPPVSQVAANEATATRLVFRPGVMIRGRIVQMPSRKPVALARLNAIIPPGIPMPVVTDSEGRFRFASPPGELQVWNEISLGSRVAFHINELSKPREVKVPDEGPDIVLPDIEIPDFVWVSGVLKDSNGTPIAHDAVRFGLESALSSSAMTDSNGHFWLPVTLPVDESFRLIHPRHATVESREPLVLRGKPLVSKPYVTARLVEGD